VQEETSQRLAKMKSSRGLIRYCREAICAPTPFLKQLIFTVAARILPRYADTTCESRRNSEGTERYKVLPPLLIKS
jgi:hypothetical protein